MGTAMNGSKGVRQWLLSDQWDPVSGADFTGFVNGLDRRSLAIVVTTRFGSPNGRLSRCSELYRAARASQLGSIAIDLSSQSSLLKAINRIRQHSH
jgi:hypothetical protein